jgi:hypothetical protein
MGCTPAVAVKLAADTWTIEKLIEEAGKQAKVSRLAKIMQLSD